MTGLLPGDLVGALSARFRVMMEDGGSMPIEKWYSQGLHSFLTHIASVLDLLPSFKRVALMQVDLNGTVHLLHLLLSVLVGLFSTARRILPEMESCPAMASLPWLIFPWMTLGYGAPCTPY